MPISIDAEQVYRQIDLSLPYTAFGALAIGYPYLIEGQNVVRVMFRLAFDLTDEPFIVLDPEGKWADKITDELISKCFWPDITAYTVKKVPLLLTDLRNYYDGYNKQICHKRNKRRRRHLRR